MAEEKGALEKYFESSASDNFDKGVATLEAFNPEYLVKVAYAETWLILHSAKTKTEFTVLFHKHSLKKGNFHVLLYALRGIKVAEFGRPRLTLSPGKDGQIVVTSGWN